MENVLEVQNKESKKTIDKRKLFALAATAAAGLAITPLIGGAHANTGDPLMVGQNNTASIGDETVLETNTTEDPGYTWNAGFRVRNNGEKGEAIAGEASFMAIHGKSPNIALAGDCIGTYTVTPGVKYADGVGVQGTSSAVQGTGVRGLADSGVGVEGSSMNGVGVGASSQNGIALYVGGRSEFENGPGWNWTQERPAILNVRNNGLPGAPATPGNSFGYPVSIAAACPNGVGILAFGPQFGVYGTTDPGGPGTSVGIGVIGMSDMGTGVLGQSGSGIGVKATSMTGTALQVVGTSTISCDTNSPTTPALMVENSGLGISATSTSNFGLESWSPVFSVVGIAINPLTTTRPSQDLINWYTDPNRGSGGLLGYSIDGKGVVGFADTGIGVLAISKGKSALRVEGKSSFSTVGGGTIPRLKKSFTVNVASGLVTANSHISVTLTSDPTVLAGDAAVSWVQRDPANKRFTINLNKAVGKDTTFTYFIVEP